jgi:AcrR family transcriptional regulator
VQVADEEFVEGAVRFVEDLNSGVPIARALEMANDVAHNPVVIRAGITMLTEIGTIDMKRLASEAGISRASLYRCYPDKSKVEAEIARIAIDGMMIAARGYHTTAERFRVAAEYLVAHPGEAAALYPFTAMVSVDVLGAAVAQVTGDESATPLLIGLAVMAATPGRRDGDEEALRRYIDAGVATLR